MISANDTAYPRLKPALITYELHHYYTPTYEELRYVSEHTRNPAQCLGFALLLKTFQRLGYFIRVSDIPPVIVNHIAQHLDIVNPQSLLKPYDGSRNRHKHCQRIRAYLQVNAFHGGGAGILQKALFDAALVREDLADIVNVGIETLIRFHYELPTFDHLVRQAQAQRAAAYRQLFTAIHHSLGDAGRVFLNTLFIVDSESRRSLWHRLRQDATRPTISGLRLLLQRYDLLTSLSQYDALLAAVPAIKIKQLAIEARNLDAASMADVEPFKRYALVLSLIRIQRAKVADDLCDLLIKQMRKVQHLATEALQQYLKENQDKADEILRRYARIDDILQSDEPKTLQRDRVQHVLVSNPELAEYARVHTALGGKHEQRFMLTYFRPRRAGLLRILSKLQWVSSSQDDSLVQAIQLILTHRKRRSEWLSTASLDNLDWLSEPWRKLVFDTQSARQSEFVHHRQFEVALCEQLIQALSSGDLCAQGSDAYSDYRQELLSQDECAKTVHEYGEQVGLPVDGKTFVAHLKQSLSSVITQADASYPNNRYFNIVDGIPKLKRSSSARKLPGLEVLDERIRTKLEAQNLSLLDVLSDTMSWLDWGCFFGPLSGHQRKITDQARRYLLTTFAYGTGLGPAQITKAMPELSLRQLTHINYRHITAERLDEANRYVINSYRRFTLPRYWGDEHRAAADGTQWDVYENNLLSERHIRYGGYGGLAYYHVSSTYIALFSHFIPCGIWEAVYILDGLIKNESEMQADTVHGDTQAQSAPVYGLAYLLGIKIMPRIRNWKTLRFYKSGSSKLKHIGSLFTHEKINWTLIERHLPDMLQVAQSIKAGRLLPSTILRKLSTASRKNRLYFAFRELGRVVRTLFLLEYLSDEDLRRMIQTTTNKCEAFNKFAKWAYFADDVIRENVRDEQLKIIKYNHLIANLLIFHNTYAMTQALREIEDEGYELSPEILSVLSPYRTSHINRFGRYELREREVPEIDYELQLRVMTALS